MLGNLQIIVCANDNPTGPNPPRGKVSVVVAALMKSGMHRKDSSDGSPRRGQSNVRTCGQKETTSRGFADARACKHSGPGYLSSISTGPWFGEK